MSSFEWFVAALRDWILREQNDVAFLREENRVLRAQLRGRRLRLSDEERRRLAVLGHELGRAALAQVATIATADTILPEGAVLDRHRGRSVAETPSPDGEVSLLAKPAVARSER